MSEEFISTSNHVDLQVIREIFFLVGRDDFGVVFKQVRVDIVKFESEIYSLKFPDPQNEARKVFHRLNGFAKQFGFIRLIDISTRALSGSSSDLENLALLSRIELSYLIKVLCNIEASMS